MSLIIRDILTINDVDKDGDVEIVMGSDGYDEVQVYLSQLEIKEIIKHLEKQIIN